MGHYHDLSRELARSGRELRKHIPDVYSGFSSLHNGAMDSGTALTRTTKELIALAISVVEGCDGCIAAHSRSLAHLGADAQEVAEAIGVAIMMAGGPGTTEAAKAWASYEEFRQVYEERMQQGAG